jgi:flavin reductase
MRRMAPMPLARSRGVMTEALVERDDFVDAMAAAVTGVNVVTTDGAAGRLGLTVSAMISVSADPPLLLVSIRRSSVLTPVLAANGVFAVNVLGAHQAAVADTFAGRSNGRAPYDFAAARWDTGALGAPLLRDAAARFECEVAGRLETGTHTLFLGAVVAADRSKRPPLAYVERRYAALRPLLR